MLGLCIGCVFSILQINYRIKIFWDLPLIHIISLPLYNRSLKAPIQSLIEVDNLLICQKGDIMLTMLGTNVMSLVIGIGFGYWVYRHGLIDILNERVKTTCIRMVVW